MAAMDTAAPLTGCVLYELDRHPSVLEQVQAEIDAAWASGTSDAETFRRKMPTLHSAILETFRLHPVFSAIPRATTRAFEFAGCHIEPGQWLLFATPVTHFLPRFFPDPSTFDIERERRGEYRQPGAFYPFATGPHICIGQHVSEAVMMTTVATILRMVRLELPPGYVLKSRW